ncbi:hypothetical protein SLEP1_g57052 [Rubroshorea leprosula]|uniref:Uncharacterized protein n=1 Tax=Rubroshorea leprosula TaxID=152421 RepID=A0AAV5MNB1_9ROSI|nr:hypothetical protein SLEP1_g57052 [Rubroshorea leprosula]
MFEKVAYDVQERDNFSSEEIKELMVGVGPIAIKTIYEHWRQKWQRMGMPLIQRRQIPEENFSFWENQCDLGGSSWFSFFWKEIKWDLLLGMRSIDIQHITMNLLMIPHYLRRQQGYFHDKIQAAWDISPWAMMDLIGIITRNFKEAGQRNLGLFYLLVKCKCWVFTIRDKGREKWNKQVESGLFWLAKPAAFYLGDYLKHDLEQLDDSDLDEYRLRGASAAARHALNMAKHKREKAHRLMFREDAAVHKAAFAVNDCRCS